jgi:hypothetical protein
MECDYLSPKTRAMLDRSVEDRIAYMRKDSWIPYPSATQILRQMEDLLRHPICERMPNLAISAKTNNGKTRLLSHFMSLHPAQDNPGGNAVIAPALYLQCPGVPDEARLYDAILTKLFKKFRVSASPREKIPMVLDVLREIGLRVLIIDETNYTESGSVNQQKAFLNALRYMGGELKISIVTAGTEEMMRVIRTVPAVENRFIPSFLPLWGCDEDFRKLLASFESLIPLPKPSNLSGELMASLLHERCGGTIGELKLLLVSAAECAMRKDAGRITKEVVDACEYKSPSKRKSARVPL